jgi:hypothetical protein
MAARLNNQKSIQQLNMHIKLEKVVITCREAAVR